MKVNDLSKQMEEMRKYHEYIKKLKDQGASQSMLNELASMDAADGMEFAKQLANMSEEDFAQVNDYYKERDELAQELAEDLYSSDVSDLNEKLSADIAAQFGMLPEEIQAIGKDSVDAFIAGLESGDLSTKVSDFFEDFFNDSKEAVEDIIADENIDITDMFDADTNSIGEELTSNLHIGLEPYLDGITASVNAEQSSVAAEYTAGNKAETDTKADSGKTERIVIENRISAELDVDGEKMAEKVIEKTEVINRRKGK